MEFMAVVFIGAVEFEKNDRKVQRIKNDTIMTQAFYHKTHEQITAIEETVLLVFHRNTYKQIQTKLLADINEKERDEIDDIVKSDFFIELHLKDYRARNFFDSMGLEFYFKGETISEAGELPQKFYIIFRGVLWEQNHIYIREHNKWPLPHRRWEVRAVYNSFENTGKLGRHGFFGDEEIISALRLKATHVAQTHTILFSMDKELFIDSLTIEDFKRLKKYRNEHANVNYTDFERSVRDRVKSHHEHKKIIHKAIDASFVNRREFPKKKISLIEKLEKQMTQSIDQQLLNSRTSKFFEEDNVEQYPIKR